MDGLDNYQVGFPATLPTVGVLLDPTSYPICGSVSGFVVSVGHQEDFSCPEELQENMYQYVVVQSLDVLAERLCLAEVGVYEPGQYMQIRSVIVDCCSNKVAWLSEPD